MSKTATGLPTDEWGLTEPQRTAVSRALGWILGAGAAGAGARSLLGMGEMLAGRQRPRPYRETPTVISIPYRVRTQSEGEESSDKVKARNLDFGKSAGGPGTDLRGQSDIARILGYLSGNSAESYDQVPWYPLAAMLGAPLAAYGGYNLVDSRLRGQRIEDAEDELEESKKRYQKAVQGEFGPTAQKAAADVSAMLDSPALGELFKKAGPDDSFLDSSLWPTNWPGVGPYLQKGVDFGLPYYLLAGGLGALGAGSLAHSYTRALDPEREKAKTIREQIEQENLSRIPPLYAQLVPIDEQGRRIPDEEIKKRQGMGKASAEMEGRAAARSGSGPWWGGDVKAMPAGHRLDAFPADGRQYVFDSTHYLPKGPVASMARLVPGYSYQPQQSAAWVPALGNRGSLAERLSNHLDNAATGMLGQRWVPQTSIVNGQIVPRETIRREDLGTLLAPERRTAVPSWHRVQQVPVQMGYGRQGPIMGAAPAGNARPMTSGIPGLAKGGADASSLETHARQFVTSLLARKA